MIHFKFSEKDNRLLFLKFDTNEDYQHLLDLKETMNLVDPVCYLPTFQGREPFTQDFLFEYRQSSGNIIFYCSIGLWHVIYKWLKKNKIEFDGLNPDDLKRKLPHNFEDFKKIVDSWNLSKNPRPYQYDAAYKILEWNRSVSELATRAGKTLISYIVFRYMMEYMGAKRILMIVPSIDLVKQGFQDFSEYAEFFDTECIWSGGKVVESSNLSIATFQSIINYLDPTNKKYNPKFFEKYDVVFVDETHRATAKSIKTIISQDFVKNLKLLFGMTGTLPKEWTIENYTVHALLGAKIQEITAKELQDQNYISNIKIYQHQIEYRNYKKQLDTWIKCAEYAVSTFVTKPNENNPKKKDQIPLQNPEFLIAFKKEFPNALQVAKDTIFRTYSDEYEAKLAYHKTIVDFIKAIPKTNLLHVENMMVHFFEERIDYLIDLLRFDCVNGNTLVLAEHREYIKHVYERVKEAFPERKVLYVIGGSKDRKTVKEQLKTEKDAILIAGYKLMSTGITLPNLHHGVLFESFKSDVIVTQSLGRGLGLVDGKDYYEVHDITDTFSPKYATNKIYQQGQERQKIYEKRCYPFEVIKRKL
ncbi:MAG: DEAD/DEAH box helicase family protein [Erysipelotrichales bacterium]|nr:DEAD/DEAH box helicase family protein [Erysipelotrichales bacterium]